MIPASALPFKASIYTFVTHSGENIHIFAGGLRLHCLESKTLEIFIVPVNFEMGQRLLRDNIISPVRAQELYTRFQSSKEGIEPVIFCKDGTLSETNGQPNVMLVDGHHRYFLAASLKVPLIAAYVLEPEDWQPFQISGLPDTTQAALQAAPITKRSY